MIIKRWSELLSFLEKPSKLKSFLERFFGMLLWLTFVMFMVALLFIPIVYIGGIEGNGWACVLGIVIWLIIYGSLCFAIFSSKKITEIE